MPITKSVRALTKYAAIPAMALCLSTSLLPSTAEAARYERFSVGGWKGGIYVSDKTGRFTNCVVSARYKSGITLLFSVSRQLKWKIGFSKPSWNLDQGKDYPVRYQVDRNRIFSGNAYASSQKLAILNLPGSTSLFQQMRRGRTLRVRTGQDTLAFNLTGTSRMLRALLNCARDNRDLRVQPAVSQNNGGSFNNSAPSLNNSNPSYNNSQPAPAPRRQTRRTRRLDDIRNEANGWFKTYLADAPTEYRIIPNRSEAAQKMYKKHALVWNVGRKTGIFGTLRIYPKKETAALESSVLAYEARTCKGNFASKFFKDDGAGSVRTNSLLATCSLDTGKTWNTYYVITNREQGGSYLTTLFSTRATADAVADAGDQVVGTLKTSGAPAPAAQPIEDDLPVRDGTKEF